LKWLQQNNAAFRGTIAERNQKGIEYVNASPQVQQEISDILALSASYSVGGVVTLKATDLYLAIDGALKDGQLIAQNHYAGSVAAVNDISATIIGLDPLIPPGSTQVMNLAGAAATAYLYGFFFSP